MTSLNQARSLRAPKWRISGRGRTPDDGYGQEVPAGPGAGGPFQAAPVAVPASPAPVRPAPLRAVPRIAPPTVLAPSPEPMPEPDRWTPAGYGGFALDTLLWTAERFITLFHSESQAGPPDRRIWQVRREIEATGTYRHTPDELTFGARLAWRNSSRCIGRLYWHSLQVRDRRDVITASGIAAESVEHLRLATNKGKIRPVITVFAPDAPGRPGPRIFSQQVIRYAGYEAADETVTGDPAAVDITRLALDLGWAGGQPRGPFDILPLIVQVPGASISLHEVPRDAVTEVTIEHPKHDWFAELGLRWYAVPVISDMYMAIGGVCYPAAPFNGWYMCTEIGSRNLGDGDRYNQLPVIAQRLGLDTDSPRTLWKDMALTELNLAVLHSYGQAGVTISDHHTESARFLQHVDREQRHGRVCPADWSWIVPPAASSATPVFHRYYDNFDMTPNFYRHPTPAFLNVARAGDGRRGAARGS